MIRHFTLRLFLPILCAFIFAQVTKADEVIIGQLKYRLYDNWTAEVSSRDESISGDIVIPGEITYNDSKYAVTGIGTFGFTACEGITSITLPVNLTSIRALSFNYCSNLRSFIVPEDNPTFCSIDGVVFSKDKTEVTVFPPGKSDNYNIPDGTSKIGKTAFFYCTNLISVTIPNSVLSIEEEAFKGCQSLTNITFPNGLTTIGYSAFEGCKGLTAITIPASVTSIAPDFIEKPGRYGSNMWAFSGCKNLKKFTVADDNPRYSTIDGVLFNKEKTELIGYPNAKSPTYSIPNSVITIGENAFERCSDLTSVVISASVAKIDNFAFTYCSSLKSVTLGKNVTSIEFGAFYNCENLASINIPNSITVINSSTFEYCKSLTSINIPNSVQTIYSHAFDGCENLSSINIPNSVINVDYDAFKNTAWYNNHKDGLIYAGRTLYEYKGTMPQNTTIEVMENTVSICAKAFMDCTGLTSITLPKGLTSINWASFQNCTGLKEIHSANPTPPRCTNETFGETDASNCVLYVPFNSERSYQNADGWKTFTNIRSCYFASASQTAGGKVTINNQTIGTLGLSRGESVTFKITADQGYSIDKITLNDKDITKKLINSQYTVSSVDDNMNLDVVFKKDQINITAIYNQLQGKVKLNDEIISNKKVMQAYEEAVFMIIPNNGLVIKQVLVNGQDVTFDLENNAFYTIEKLTEDIELKAFFDKPSDIALTPETDRPNIYAAHGKVVIENAPEGEKISIVNLTGQLVYQGMETEIPLGRGLYLVRIGKTVKKVMAE